MLAVVVNAVAVIFGGLLGVLLKKGIPEKIEKAIMIAIGLCVTYIGIAGALKGENQLVIVLGMAAGVIVGTLIDIDKQVNRVGQWIENKFSRGEKKVSIAEGFVTASLIFCIGAMAVTGSLEAGLGLKEGYDTIYTKATIDCITSICLASTLGIGVCFSSVFILVFQGAICLLAGLLSGILTPSMTNELICAGSLMIAAIGTNFLGITKIKVANLMPGIVFAPFFSWLFTFVASKI